MRSSINEVPVRQGVKYLVKTEKKYQIRDGQTDTVT